MNNRLTEQAERIKDAKYRLKAETTMGRDMLPEAVKEEMHYNSNSSAIKRFPEFTELIEVL